MGTLAVVYVYVRNYLAMSTVMAIPVMSMPIERDLEDFLIQNLTFIT